LSHPETAAPEFAYRPKGHLNKYANWRDVLGVLNGEPQGYALPAGVTCPLCRGRLHVQDDLTYAGEWYACRDCRFRGDSIELAAAAWDVSLHDALARLTALHVCPKDIVDGVNVEKTLDRAILHRRRVQTLFDKASRSCLGLAEPQAQRLRGRLGMPHLQYTPEQWQSRGGQFMGMLFRHQFAEVFFPLLFKGFKEGREDYPDQEPLFRPGNWEYFVVLPAWDVPGRICGMGLLGHEGDPVRDFRYRLVLKNSKFGWYSPATNKAGNLEAGLFMLPAVMGPPHPEFGDSIFVAASPVAAARLHIRHLTDTDISLPLVATWDNGFTRTLRVWRQFVGRPVYFLADKVTRHLIEQAQLTDGRIALVADQRLMEAMHRGQPAALLRWMRDRAVPWRQVLADFIERADFTEATDVLGDITLAQHDAEALLAGTSRSAAARQLMEARWRPRHVRLHPNYTIREERDGWYVGRHNARRLSNFIFRVTHQVTCSVTDDRFSLGTMAYKGVEHKFACKSRDLLRSPAGFFQAYFRRRGIDETPRAFALKHGLLQVATYFHRPTALRMPTVVGWSKRDGEFVFPRFRIAPNGVVTENEIDLGRVRADSMPCGLLGAYRDLGVAEVAWLSRNNATTRTYWALTAALLAHLLRDQRGLAHEHIALAGPNVDLALQLARHLGCVDMPIQLTKKRSDYRHAWPRVLDERRIGGETNKKTKTMLGMQEPIVGNPDLLLIALDSFERSWNIIRTTAGASQDVPDDARLVLPAYLRDLTSRHLRLADGGGLGGRVLADLEEWFARIGGERAAVRAAGDGMLWGEKKAEWQLGFLVAALSTRRALSYIDAPVLPSERAKSFFRRYADGTIGLAQHDVDSILMRKRGFTMPRERLAALFEDAGLAHTPRSYLDGKSRSLEWVMPEEWFFEQLRFFGMPLVTYEENTDAKQHPKPSGRLSTQLPSTL
jgi:hypothetical protein